MDRLRDLRRVPGPCHCGRETRWRDAVFEAPFDIVQNGASLRSQAVKGHAALPVAEAETTIHLHLSSPYERGQR